MTKFSAGIALLFFFAFCNGITIAENEERIYRDYIKTVMLHNSASQLSNPVIALQSNEKIILKFDDLSGEINSYDYKVVACNSDWTNTAMFPAEYIEGFQESAIIDYYMSSAVNSRYVHFRLELPNFDMSFKKSGNYLLKVYVSGYPDSVVLTRRFMVYENIADLEAFVKRPAFSPYFDTHQEVIFQADLKRLNVQLAQHEVKAVLMQNFRWDNSVYDIKPVFVRENILEFRREGVHVFPALKEFRYVDFRNMFVRNERIKSFSANKIDSIFLVPEASRRNESYRFFSDINGRFNIGIWDRMEQDWESDYVHVVFRYASKAVYKGGDIYLFGKITDWKILPEYRFVYNDESHTYEGTFLLKQGFYNYFYAYSKQPYGLAQPSATEGDYFEAENEYQVFLYYRPVGSRYDRLIAYTAVDNFGNRRK